MLYKTIDKNLSGILKEQAGKGLRVDHDILKDICTSHNASFLSAKEALNEELGTLNPNSMVQVAEALKNKGLEWEGKLTSDILRARASAPKADPVLQKIIEFRKLSSINSSVSGFNNKLGNDGRLHPVFEIKQESGSSRLYAKPSVTSVSKVVRKAIIPDEGKKFVYVDYSTAELMFLAYLAGQEDLVEVYKNEEDVFQFISDKLNLEYVDRDATKIIVYSTLFGSEGGTASEILGISLHEAKKAVDTFYDVFPEIKAYRAEYIEESYSALCAKTWSGRPMVAKPAGNSFEEMKIKRMFICHAVQSGFGDVIRKSIADLQPVLQEGFRIVTQVFDSYLFEIPEHFPTEEFFGDIVGILTEEFKWNFSVGEGKNWFDAQESAK